VRQSFLFCSDIDQESSWNSTQLAESHGRLSRVLSEEHIEVAVTGITPPNLYNSPPSKPNDDGDSPAEEATIPRRIQFPTPEHLQVLPMSHHQPVETGNTMPQNREEMSPTGTRNPRFALHRADKVMKRAVPIDRSNRWEKVVGRIKWVMDMLGPIAEVRVIPF
jgi:hypothetical protein